MKTQLAFPRGVLTYIYDRGAQVTFLGPTFECKLLFWVSQLYNYFFRFMKCQIIFWVLNVRKVYKVERNMAYTRNVVYFSPMADRFAAKIQK